MDCLSAYCTALDGLRHPVVAKAWKASLENYGKIGKGSGSGSRNLSCHFVQERLPLFPRQEFEEPRHRLQEHRWVFVVQVRSRQEVRADHLETVAPRLIRFPASKPRSQSPARPPESGSRVRELLAQSRELLNHMLPTSMRVVILNARLDLGDGLVDKLQRRLPVAALVARS
jgi:hypothetical protein